MVWKISSGEEVMEKLLANLSSSSVLKTLVDNVVDESAMVDFALGYLNRFRSIVKDSFSGVYLLRVIEACLDNEWRPSRSCQPDGRILDSSQARSDQHHGKRGHRNDREKLQENRHRPFGLYLLHFVKQQDCVLGCAQKEASR